MTTMTFEYVSAINQARSKRWHQSGDGWTVSDWAVAMAGESGEACNAVKKLRRIQCNLANINEPGRQLTTEQQAIDKIGDELADTFLYMDLLAQSLGINLTEHIVAMFNKKSEEYGFPERL